MNTKISYDISLLEKCLQKDNATLIGSYEKINSTIKIYFKCSCGNEYSKLFRGIVNDGGLFCKLCCIKNAKIKRIETNRLLFGTDSALQNKDKIEKLKKTNLQKYGVEFVLSSKEITEKRKNTNKNKTSAEKLETIIKQQKSLKNKSIEEQNIIIEKRKNTNLKKYGVTTTLLYPETKIKIKKTLKEKYGVELNISQSKEIQTKIKQKCIEKYGVNNHQSRQEIKDKTKNTNLQKYGVISPMCLVSIQDKVKKTNINKYGVEYALQNPEIHEKSSKKSKKYKNYIFPSGVIKRVQGYEPFALDELLKKFDESQIKIGRKEIPTIKYLSNNSEHIYFPDIFIPHLNMIIEVKSTWTYKCKKDNINLKSKACIDSGYMYELWIYDKKKNKTIVSM